jgi:hypothetical protein
MAGDDIAMNQFQIVSDADYVYVEKGNSQGKIEKNVFIDIVKRYITSVRFTGSIPFRFYPDAGRRKDLRIHTFW